VAGESSHVVQVRCHPFTSSNTVPHNTVPSNSLFEEENDDPMIAGMSGCVDRDADVAGRERAKLSADHDDDVVDGLAVCDANADFGMLSGGISTLEAV